MDSSEETSDRYQEKGKLAIPASQGDDCAVYSADARGVFVVVARGPVVDL